MQLDETLIKKIEALALLMQKSPEAVLNEAVDSYLEAQQKKAMEEELEKRRKETTLSYDEFWDGLDI